jgi:hypothetical protein
MSGKYTFYVTANTTGSLVESLHSFIIETNAPGLSISSSITLYGTSEVYSLGRLIISPNNILGYVYSYSSGSFSRNYALSGSWVASLTFLPYGVSNEDING